MAGAMTVDVRVKKIPVESVWAITDMPESVVNPLITLVFRLSVRLYFRKKFKELFDLIHCFEPLCIHDNFYRVIRNVIFTLYALFMLQTAPSFRLFRIG